MKHIDKFLIPINKTAALVTSQSGCASDDTLTTEQKRENLVTKAKYLEAEILSSPKGSKRRGELGKIKVKLCLEINSLRPKMKCKGVTDHIMDILKDELTPFEFKRILRIASKRARVSDGLGTKEPWD